MYTGRKQALTPVQADQLRAAIASGRSKAAAARDYGISRQTVYQYLRLTPTVVEADLTAVLARLPQDTRPPPSVAAYDELLQRP